MTLYKHWKDADKRAKALREESEQLNTRIGAHRTAIANTEIDVEARETLLSELSDMVDQSNRITEEYDKAIEVRDGLRVKENQQIGLADSVNSVRINGRVSMSSDDVIASRSYAHAWAGYIRTGDDAEVRQLISTTENATSGILVPKLLMDRIEDAIHKGGRILSLCTIDEIKGLTSHPVVASKSNPNWHEETGADEKEEKEIKFTSVDINPEFVAEVLAITKKFEALSIEAFWAWLLAELPDAIKRKIDGEILIGPQSGTSGIRGILTNTNTAFVGRIEAPVMDFNIVNNAVGHLGDGTEENITVVMNRLTFFNNIQGLRGADGHPIYTSSADNDKVKFYINGFQVVFNSTLPPFDQATVDQDFMVVGDFKGFFLNFPDGKTPRVIRDEISRKKENIVEYLPEVLVGGNITRLHNFVAVRKGATGISGVPTAFDASTQAIIGNLIKEAEAAKAEAATAMNDAEAARAEVATVVGEVEAQKAKVSKLTADLKAAKAGTTK